MWIWIILLIILVNIVYPRILARYILYLFGWGAFSIQFKDIFSRYDKMVVIYPHTSYWDSVLMVLHRLAFPDVLGEMVFLIRPDFLNIPILGAFFNSIGGIAATSIHEEKGGRTQSIIDYLNRKGKFRLIVSPKGTTQKSSWRSGYYYITKGTNAKITVAGLDYKSKSAKIFTPQNEGSELSSKETLENWLKVRMRTLSQYNPQNLEY